MKNTELVVVAHTAKCSGGQCPTIYTDPHGDLVIQGYISTLECPDGEQAVVIPASLVADYLKNRESGN